MFGDFLSDFITIWVIIDPITALPIFIGLTGAFDKPTRRKIAAMSTFVALIVLVFFIVVGQIIINSMGISLRAFEVAGGLILFLFAVEMVIGKDPAGAGRRIPPDPHAGRRISPGHTESGRPRRHADGHPPDR